MVIFEPAIEGVGKAALTRFLVQAARAVRLRGAVSVMVTTSRQVRDMNRCFRGKDQPTDVLSFPAEQKGLAGDIAISADIARQNARRLGHSLAEELKVLILHGVLHLAGYDHEKDDGKMAKREAALREELGLSTSLTERAAGTRKRKRARRTR